MRFNSDVFKDNNEARAGAVGSVTFGFWLIWWLSGFLFPSSGWWNAFPATAIYLADCISFLILAKSKPRTLAVVGACGYGLGLLVIVGDVILAFSTPKCIMSVAYSFSVLRLSGTLLNGIALWRLYAGRRKWSRLSVVIGFYLSYLLVLIFPYLRIDWLAICFVLIHNALVGVGFVSLFIHANKEIKNHGN